MGKGHDVVTNRFICALGIVLLGGLYIARFRDEPTDGIVAIGIGLVLLIIDGILYVRRRRTEDK